MLFAQKHGEFRRYPIHAYRLGTYKTNFNLLVVGRLWEFGVSVFGRQSILLRNFKE